MFLRVASIVLLTALTLPVGAQDHKISQLAKEGHWLPEKWEQHAPLLGKQAPKLDLSDWINGELSKEDMEGKIVIVDFWATWCGPCINAIPHNNEMVANYKDKGVLLVGICGSGRGEEKMASVVKDKGITYPVAHPTADTTKAWGVAYWPTYAVVDRNGIVRALGIKPDYVDKIVDALLLEQPK
ncbi:MAG: TlpA family protein disulfide reductase [Holophagaceae bacterium]|nr:TlpA family protein disulfide reductase [Holophagaceae bacterium]